MHYPYLIAKKHIEEQLTSVLKKLQYPSDVSLEIPPVEMGDFAFPCFSLCKISKCSPVDTANKIKDMMESDDIIDNVTTKGGYVNFHVNTRFIINETLSLIEKLNEKYGWLDEKKKKVIIEHTSANPNGPLHVGRARNPIIGDTLTRIYKAAGYDCESQFYLDDLGKQVAILTWGQMHLPEISPSDIENKKPDHIAVLYYQKANDLMQEDSKIKDEISDLVKKSEHGDQKSIDQGKKAYSPVLKGMKESLDMINIGIDSVVPESKFVKDKSVEKAIANLKKTEYCHEEDGAFYLDLEPFGIHGRNMKFFITRRDGTSLYATRDIAYHQWKAKQADMLINILGEDHKLEAKQVEIGLKLLKEENTPNPVFYSFVSLPGGKMSTRRGRVVYLDDLIDECIIRAFEEVKKRRSDDLSEKQMRSIADIIGIGALRYNIIKVQPEKDIVFKWEEALNFEGNSAPFIQYAHARAAGILSKTDEFKKDSLDVSVLTHNSELILGKKLAMFPEIIQDAAVGFKPHIICSYLFELASLFNQFYRDCPVVIEKEKKIRNARIHLVSATKTVLHNGLDIIGIKAPDEM